MEKQLVYFDNEQALNSFLSSRKLTKAEKTALIISATCPECNNTFEKSILTYLRHPVFLCSKCSFTLSTKDIYSSQKKQTSLKLNNPIHINTIQECDQLSSNQRISYTCCICNKESITYNFSFKKRNKFLCRSCSSKQQRQTSQFRDQSRQAQLNRTAESIEKSNKKREITCLSRFGVKNVMKLDSKKDKIKQTCLDKYGVENYNQTDTAKQHLSEVMKNNSEERQQKSRQTCFTKYGKEYYTQTQDMKEKSKQTCLEKYGVTNGGGSEGALNKIKNTLKQHYNEDVSSAFQIEEVKEKIKQTCLEKYGVPYSMQADSVRDKAKQTCLKKYGVEYYSQTQEMNKYHKVTYEYTNIYFDSSWELAFYIWHIDNNKNIQYHTTKIAYYVDNKQHFYYPDFIVDNKIFEIKGSHLLKNDNLINPYNKSYHLQQLNSAKYKCMKENKVEIISTKEIKPYLDYMNLKYGKDWKLKFKHMKEIKN